jgi:hypothetical protein
MVLEDDRNMPRGPNSDPGGPAGVPHRATAWFRSPAGITIRRAVSDADLMAAAIVQHHAYQMPYPPSPHDIARLIRLTQRGGLVAIAADNTSGTVTGTGLTDVASDRPARRR